ncbi:hypothetical protein BDY17DRAFT_293046 [Neohortaea acidophila]|uniref:Uncharacterized protein n=1 Tax=Neohortaea acidophila TaxID=245834 RepID=A0A6A6PZK5_9PEZI|nr:uncharacterized protein BDY17DRAFT_293046 [Neohortaea acidophila]KAF2485169.1 hypothetical protein BDY17DRAFT_293046 [Neohortaea acidophila]
MARSKSKVTKITKTKVTKAKKTNTPTAQSQGNKGTKVALVARGWTDIPRPDEEGDWEAALEACKQPRKERNRLAPYFFSCRGVLYSNVIRPMLNWRDEAGRLKITKEQAKGIWSTSRGKYEAFVADDTGVGLVAKKRGNEGRSTVQTAQKPVRKSDGRFESWPQAKEGRQAKATNLVPQRKTE